MQCVFTVEVAQTSVSGPPVLLFIFVFEHYLKKTVEAALHWLLAREVICSGFLIYWLAGHSPWGVQCWWLELTDERRRHSGSPWCSAGSPESISIASISPDRDGSCDASAPIGSLVEASDICGLSLWYGCLPDSKQQNTCVSLPVGADLICNTYAGGLLMFHSCRSCH